MNTKNINELAYALANAVADIVTEDNISFDHKVGESIDITLQNIRDKTYEYLRYITDLEKNKSDLSLLIDDHGNPYLGK